MKYLLFIVPAILILPVVWLLASIFFISPSLEYVDQNYKQIPAESRHEEIANMLTNCNEVSVDVEDIPKAYYEGLAAEIVSKGEVSVYKYYYILPIFSFYLIYNQDGLLQQKIPSYE